MYCKFCGAKLEDGQVCTCPEAQQAAQQPAAAKGALSQEQKDEMKRTMLEAGKSAKAAGKALWSSAKVVGGAALDQAREVGGAAMDQAKSLAGAAQGAASGGGPAIKKGPDLYRKIMMAFGALHVFLYFFFSYGRLGSRNDTVRYAEQMLKISLPKRLTGPAFLRVLTASVRYGGSGADEAYTMAVMMFALPVVLGLLIILLNCLGKKKGMIGSVVLSVLTLLGYVVINALMSEEARAFEEIGYKMGFGFGFVVIVALVIVQTVVAVKGHAACKKAQTAA